MRANWVGIALAAGLIAGCDMGAMPGNRAPAAQSELITATAVVESVDQSTREVVMRGPDGGALAVIAGPEVRNLAQLEAGDVVELDYYESVAVEMAPEGAPDEAIGVFAARAPEGAKPGGVAVVTTEIVVEMISYNADAGLARVRTPEGEEIAVTVPPRLRNFAAARSPGERVAVTVSEALAVSIVETA